MKRRTLVPLTLAGLLFALALIPSLASAGSATPAKPPQNCAKFSGTVVLTYTNPDTIILHIIKGKVNAATTFTMTPTTAYQRNSQPASFADIKIGDTGTITATEQLPSGTLNACSVNMTGP